MTNKKAIAVTVAIIILFGALLICLAALKIWIAAGLIIGILAVIGIGCAVSFLYQWLTDAPEEETIEPVIVADRDQADADPTLDQIMEEFK